jgi:hypothetical protein
MTPRPENDRLRLLQREEIKAQQYFGQEKSRSLLKQIVAV